MSRHLAPILLLVALLLAPNVAAQSEATRVAVCDVSAVLAGMAETRVHEEGLQQKNTELRAELERRQKEIEQIREEMGLLKSSSDRFQELRLRVQKLAIEADATRRIRQEALVTENKLFVIATYNKINEAIAKYADQNGIELVIANQQELPPLETLTPEQLTRALSLRMVLHRSDAIDITEAVLASLNADYLAENPGADAPPTESE